MTPTSKVKTPAKLTPSEQNHPDAYEQFAVRKGRYETLVERARSADLQQRAWLLRFVPINLGDYLEIIVRHDELHIDQAQRALAAYRQFAAA